MNVFPLIVSERKSIYPLLMHKQAPFLSSPLKGEDEFRRGTLVRVTDIQNLKAYSIQARSVNESLPTDLQIIDGEVALQARNVFAEICEQVWLMTH